MSHSPVPLFDHVQNGYTVRIRQPTKFTRAVDTRARSLSTQTRRDIPRICCSHCKCRSNSSTAARSRTSHLAPRTSTPRSSRARARTTSGHRQHDRCTGTTPASCRPSPPFVQFQPRLRRRLRVHASRTRTAQLCLGKPLHTPVVPGSVRMIWCIDD